MKALYTLALTALLAGPAAASPVLVISVDGLRAGDVLDAPARGMNLPTLRGFMTNGTYANGVRDMLPSITYPNHTTLITGVAPALHGIINNYTFDPFQKNFEGWYWYSSDIKVPTLWDAVHKAGGKVASWGWPVTVGNPSIDDLVPEYWRAYTPDDRKLLFALSTPGLIARLEKATGIPYAATAGTAVTADDGRTKYMAALIAMDHPMLTTVHLSSVDQAEHKFGPGSPEAKATLETLDKSIGVLVAAAKAAQPDIVIALVSDHGFRATTKAVNLTTAFVDAGLVTLDPVTKKIVAWDAMPWFAAGSHAIMLARPDDAALNDKVAALLKTLAADPANGIAGIADKAEIARQGGGAAPNFWVEYADGYMAGKNLTGPLVTPSPEKGTHGYFPAHLEMRSNFLIQGAGIAKGKALGEIDMRDIAPTLAKVLDVPFPSATGKPLF